MYRNLSVITPDSSATLSIAPIGKLIEKRSRKQLVTIFDDRSEEAVSESSDIFYTVTLPWEYLDSTDAGTVLEFFFDTSKANGIKSSFNWDHPRDSHTYTAKFKTNISRSINPPEWYKFNPITLLIIGKES